ncbi:NUDIX hydrolase [Arthrobacter sp. zg-Y1110]|uniref:NUDIX hydrolase n=1 Tax=Arthrobacter sp. zg-Y1110 TaxID=2886932 RepID=UPI001D14DBA8|nr:NUDIX hydrolase [Arthrobacter sp. zg-Y1110]MCC3292880.1 NUDIX hydrolase [Arthrobacter sp. zg-Y1110]UWX86818.1 NUDIX hydrolase [Arthrobacter sp. zg-Y1110]
MSNPETTTQDLPEAQQAAGPPEDAVIRRVREHVDYENRFVTVHFDDVVFPNGAQGRYTRITTGAGLGVIAVPYANFRGIPYLGLVRQYRYPVGEFTLEFPRGGSDDLSLEEAARELVEETGLGFNSGRLLGTIRPDTGILDTEVAVWCTTHTLDGLDSGHVEDETGATVRWYSHGEVMGLVTNGKITCGMTLAALALIQNAGVIREF